MQAPEAEASAERVHRQRDVAMARPREFDETAVVDEAMRTFWRLGYDATSVAELERATGLSRISIYSTFGDKEGLFLRALDRYHGSARPIFEESIARGGLEGLEDFFLRLSARSDTDSPASYGCLMVNTVLDIRQATEPVRQRIEVYRAMLLKSYARALRNAVKDGELIASRAQLRDRSQFLLGAQWGALAMIRFGGETTAARPMANVVVQTIRSWRESTGTAA